MGLGGILQGLFGGASPQEELNAKLDLQFMQTLQAEQGTIFSENQQIQNQLNTAWNPIIQGGPYQYGFSTAEDQLLQNQIRTEGAQQTTNTLNAAELRQQQATGGASAGPTGGQAALTAMAAQTEAQQTAESLSREKLAGYERGAQLFGEATNVKQGELAVDNPVGYANAANTASEATNKSNQIVDTANANSLTAKLIGGAAQAGLAAATGGLSSLASSAGTFATPATYNNMPGMPDFLKG